MLGRGEVENASTFLASAVNEPSVFTARRERAMAETFVVADLTESKTSILPFQTEQGTETISYNSSRECRVLVAKSHDPSDHPLASPCFKELEPSNRITIPLENCSLHYKNHDGRQQRRPQGYLRPAK